MNSTKARPLGYYFVVLIVIAIAVVAVSLLSYYWIRGSTGNKRFEAKLAELQQSGAPIDNKSLETVYRASTEDSDTTEWLKVFSELEALKKTTTIQGVYGLDPRAANTPFVASGEWKYEQTSQHYVDQFRSIIERIRQLASARKHVYVPKSFDTDYIDLNELDRVRDSAKLLRLDGHMCIRQKKPQQLLDDILALFNLSETFENEPGIVSCLISLASDDVAIDLIEDALAAHALGKTELTALQTRLLEETAHVPLWKKVIRDERAFSIPSFRNPKTYAAQLKGKSEGIPMRGWDGLRYLELMEMADAITGEDYDEVMAIGAKIEDELNRMKRNSLSEIALTLRIFPSTRQMSYSLIKRENRMRTATYATACELYMAEHGQASASLEILALPHDRLKLSGGKAPGYQVMPDGSVELWYFDLEKDKSTPAKPPGPKYPESPAPISFVWKIPAPKTLPTAAPDNLQ